jgi:hypothetical protein
VVRAVEDTETFNIAPNYFKMTYVCHVQDTMRAGGFYPRLLAALPRVRVGDATVPPHAPERIEIDRSDEPAKMSQEFRVLPQY